MAPGETALEDVQFAWRGELRDSEMVDLVRSYGGIAVPGWWDQVSPHSVGWATARDPEGTLMGFVNVAWDGGDHAFLLDTKARGSVQRQGIGTRVVEVAVDGARLAGCEWLHVDFGEDLAPFYLGTCGFQPTAAGLIHLCDTQD